MNLFKIIHRTIMLHTRVHGHATYVFFYDEAKHIVSVT